MKQGVKPSKPRARHLNRVLVSKHGGRHADLRGRIQLEWDKQLIADRKAGKFAAQEACALEEFDE